MPVFFHTWTLFYVTTRITLHSDRFASQEAALATVVGGPSVGIIDAE